MTFSYINNIWLKFLALARNYFFFIMSSQLPNIRGGCGFILRTQNVNGAFYTNGMSGAGVSAAGPDPLMHLDASRYNSIYKDNVNQVFGDSLGMNCYIKALM